MATEQILDGNADVGASAKTFDMRFRARFDVRCRGLEQGEHRSFELVFGICRNRNGEVPF
jgi:hypothetical protein